MSSFKVGDKVIAKPGFTGEGSGKHQAVIPLQIYTVRESPVNGSYVQLEELPDIPGIGRRWAFFATSFALAGKEEELQEEEMEDYF